MNRPKKDRVSVLFAVFLFVGAGIISLNYINNISADIERGAEISPFKATDFSLVNSFDSSSWTALSNLGDENPVIYSGSLVIANTKEKYSTIISQPVMLSSGKKYKVSVQYKIKNPSADFSVKYGLVLNDLISKPVFNGDLKNDGGGAEFELQIDQSSPVMFQYFRVLGQGEFDLSSIKIEDAAQEQIPSPTEVVSATPEITATVEPTRTVTPITTNTAISTISGAKFEAKPGWNLFGSDRATDTKSFTDFGLSVYTISGDGWKTAKPGQANSNFFIPQNTGVYIANEKDSNVEVILKQSEDPAPSGTVKGWNIIYTTAPTDVSKLSINVDGNEKALSELISAGKMSKYAYLIDPNKPENLTKVNIEKYSTIQASRIVWVYLF